MNAQLLRYKFESDLRNLQKKCPHKKWQWMEYHWAPGHSSGSVRVCLNCEKILGDSKKDSITK